MTSSVQALTVGDRVIPRRQCGGERGDHFPEAGVYGFRAPPFEQPRNDHCNFRGIWGRESAVRIGPTSSGWLPSR